MISGVWWKSIGGVLGLSSVRVGRRKEDECFVFDGGWKADLMLTALELSRIINVIIRILNYGSSALANDWCGGGAGGGHDEKVRSMITERKRGVRMIG